MGNLRTSWPAVLLLALGGCGAKGPGTGPAEPANAAARATGESAAAAETTEAAGTGESARAETATTATTESAAAKEGEGAAAASNTASETSAAGAQVSLGERVGAAIRAGEHRRAEAILDEAAAEPRQAAMVAYYRATLRAYQGDFEAAEAALQEYLARETTPAADPMRPVFHNALMMLREADGDIAGALVELHEMWRTSASGQEPAQMWVLKEIWHRAYLYRMAAESAEGAARAALLRYAETARAEYANAAKRVGGYGDSVAVLDAYFAIRDGDARAALEAARRVNAEENGDLEDLYLTGIALAFGGDAEPAAAVRKKITESEDVYLAAPIMRAWVEADTRRAGRRGKRVRRWTPLHLGR